MSHPFVARIAALVLGLTVVTTGLIAAKYASPAREQGVTYRSPAGTTIRILLDEANVGPDVTLGEITFPPNQDSGDHRHGSKEIFYVLSGELEHIVNGKSQVLKPGMAGYVNPPDSVRHRTGPSGAKAVVIWVPGDEGKKITSRWTRVE